MRFILTEPTLVYMFEVIKKAEMSLTEILCNQGYWPALAERFLSEGKYSRTVEVCKQHLSEDFNLVSGWIIYGKALFFAGQMDLAEENFYCVLAYDPDNIVSLKFLGDIKFTQGDDISAMAFYTRVLEIAPSCRGLNSPLKHKTESAAKMVTLQRKPEKAAIKKETNLREIPFYTETMGDIYLAQGHNRLAAQVYRTLADKNNNPRLMDKLEKLEKEINKKD